MQESWPWSWTRLFFLSLSFDVVKNMLSVLTQSLKFLSLWINFSAGIHAHRANRCPIGSVLCTRIVSPLHWFPVGLVLILCQEFRQTQICFVLPKWYLVVNFQYMAREYLITKAEMPTNSKLLVQLSFFLKQCSCTELCVVKKKKEEDSSGTGYEDGQYPLVLYNRAVLPLFKKRTTNLKCLNFVFSFDLNNKLNDTIVGSLVRSTSRVFNDIYSRGQILYGRF